MEFDLIIIGGKPAGASLAARLALTGLKIAIVEKDCVMDAKVVSCPLFFSSGIKLMEEIGMQENIYTLSGSQMAGASLEMSTYFRTFIKMPADDEKNYVYGLNRKVFDKALWDNLSRFSTVERLEGFAVREIIKDTDGKAIGILGGYKGETERKIYGRAIVGADGRNSLVARKMEAKVTEEVSAFNTTVYYAYWENVLPYEYEGKNWIQIHTGCDGFSFILIPAGNNLTGVLAQCRHDLFEAKDGVEKWYLEKLKSYPQVYRRLIGAKQISALSGIKNVPNLYRQAYGAGWVLVGDAYHQKDSYDGQGIYDALLGAKILAKQLVAWHAGTLSWNEAMQRYDAEIYNQTQPMFQETISRLKRELFSQPSAAVIKGPMRWLLTNEDYLKQFSKLLTRQIAPENWAPKSVIIKAMLKGIVGSISKSKKKDSYPIV